MPKPKVTTTQRDPRIIARKALLESTGFVLLTVKHGINMAEFFANVEGMSLIERQNLARSTMRGALDMFRICGINKQEVIDALQSSEDG